MALPTATVTLRVGESATLQPTVAPENATDQTLDFSSADARVAYVVGPKVVGYTPGRTTVTAKATDGSGATARIKIKILPLGNGYTPKRPRIIVMQDGEVDDMASFTRLLYYSNELDIASIVYTSSRFHYKGDLETGGTVPPHRWTGTEWLNRQIDLYGKLYPKLRNHAAGYPNPDRLRKVYKIGNIDNVGEMTKVTEGSEAIRKILLDNNPEPVHAQAWGGTNTLARALKSIQEQYSGTKHWAAVQAKINKKLVIYNILTQDSTLTAYIKPTWPGVRVIDNLDQFWGFAYSWPNSVPPDQKSYLQGPYMRENFLIGRGDLLGTEYRTYKDNKPIPGDPDYNNWDPTQYPQYGLNDFISEGDSPSFMWLFDFNGLRASDDPTYGGWGGRFAKNATGPGWTDTGDPSYPGATSPRAARRLALTRWVADIQNDFATRAKWGVTSDYDDANHNPRAHVREGLTLTMKPGQSAKLHASATDPDRDALTYNWWEYADADTYAGTAIPITNADTLTPTFAVPADAKPGDTIHLILQVSDNGTPKLTHYQRVVVTVAAH
ncbi:nucleoside hydrolase-like domain-containing protein [Actinomadura sp. SCN-SB]|uniref:nucleoside hydrolase-like domain-containing protein n=1 Tax=Actinomadura sp. SCN-SB TaxID=3373092 RepID=UPI0037509AB1